MRNMNAIEGSFGDKVFGIFNYIFITIFTVTIIIPFYHVFIVSISPPDEAGLSGLHFWPSRVFLEGYGSVLQNQYIWYGFGNSIFRVAAGTALSLVLMSFAAYALSKKDLPGRDIFTLIIVLTMFFSGGLIPRYLVVKGLGLMDNRLVYILPDVIDAFYLLVLRNYFMTVPDSLEESAKIDGAGYFRIFTNIIVPVVKPILATVSLWYAVWYWNEWFSSLLYMPDVKKQVSQLVLRRILNAGIEIVSLGASARERPLPETLRAAAVFITTLPILAVYPFVQKYFVTGITLGSLKG